MYPVSPGTPDSAAELIGAASYAAHEKRHNKTIMNCFRDRTPNYTRSNSRNVIKYEQNGAGSKETVLYLKEPRQRLNKLTLLKSCSTRDLSRFIETSYTASSSSAHDMSTTSTTSTSSSNNDDKLMALEKRIVLLEQCIHDERIYTKELETKLIELTKRFDEFTHTADTKQYGKMKKSSGSIRKKATNGGTTNINVQPSKLATWMKLTNLWKHRPSIESLRKQNIYNDEPCFDTEIEVVLKHEVHKTIPKIVVDCCDLIEEQYRRSSRPVEGIYRQCGDYNKIQTLRFRIDSNDYGSLKQSSIDIHTLTGVLKLFLREIKSPLISANEAKTFIGKPNQWLLTELPAKIEILKRLIRSLPQTNRDTMEYIFSHFNRLTKVPLQQVSAETLSLSVTPSIFHTVQQGAHMQDMHVLLKEGEILADCVKTMIEYQSRIFVCTADRGRQRRISVRTLKKTLSHPDLIFHSLF